MRFVSRRSPRVGTSADASRFDVPRKAQTCYQGPQRVWWLAEERKSALVLQLRAPTQHLPGAVVLECRIQIRVVNSLKFRFIRAENECVFQLASSGELPHIKRGNGISALTCLTRMISPPSLLLTRPAMSISGCDCFLATTKRFTVRAWGRLEYVDRQCPSTLLAHNTPAEMFLVYSRLRTHAIIAHLSC